MPERKASRLLLWAVAITVLLLAIVWIAEGALSRRTERLGARLGGSQGMAPMAAATAADTCATCHARATPGIVTQHLASAHARAGISCGTCHEAAADHPLALAHQGTWVVSAPTPATCGTCHQRATREFMRSRHALPAWAALSGTDDFTPEQVRLYDQIEEVTKTQVGIGVSTRNALYDIEGPMVTPAACEACHSVGRPNLDGSVGACSSCHLRHQFSLAQARKPETCNGCHIGPDHPQWEIYQHSKHGVAYLTHGSEWNWTAPAGTLSPRDIPAATCAICHMSGFGSQGTTHDVGDRLSLYLFAPMSKWRPNALENRQRMQDVCLTCHSLEFITAAYARADAVTAKISSLELQAEEIMTALERDGLLSKEPFDHPIKFEGFELWHHWGRTAKFGAYMFGADYTQWHGIYEVIRSLASLTADAAAIRSEGVLQDPIDWPIRERTPLLERLRQWRTGPVLPPGDLNLPKTLPGRELLMAPDRVGNRIQGGPDGR